MFSLNIFYPVQWFPPIQNHIWQYLSGSEFSQGQVGCVQVNPKPLMVTLRTCKRAPGPPTLMASSMIQQEKTQCTGLKTLRERGRQPMSLKELCFLQRKREFCQISDKDVGASFIGGKFACARVNLIPSKSSPPPYLKIFNPGRKRGCLALICSLPHSLYVINPEQWFFPLDSCLQTWKMRQIC